jgi:DNA (cytosine-5)-methyltransferase 1
MWPTPTVKGNYNKKGLSSKSGDGLATAVAKETKGKGKLNPDWVEWLMGWPIGWTDLEPIETLSWMPTEWFQDEMQLPRLVMTKKPVKKRLGCIGNGQVPAAMVLAILILLDGISEGG